MTGRVIIVGAGVSGLYAATLLEKAGVDYMILEARDRTGGRVLAATPDALHVDLGATWFWPEIQPDLAQLLEALGLSVIPQGRPGDMLYERQLNSPVERYATYETSPASFRLKGGMQALTAALERQIPAHRIKTGHQVTAVSRSEQEEVQVHTRTEQGDNPDFRCSHVFLALPPGLAANINFIPALPEGVLSDWRNTPTWMAPHAKYVALYKKDFLHPQHLSGDASSRVGPMVEIHDVSEPGSPVTALFGFIGVPATSRSTLGDAALRRLCREQLVRLFGQDAAQPDAEGIKDWAADPFTATEFDLLQTGGHAVPAQIPPQEPWGRCVTGIASEWSPQFSGYLAGAIEAADEGVYGLMRQDTRITSR